MRKTTCVCVGWVASVLFAVGATAQELPSEQLIVPIDLDSGWVENTTGQRAVIFSAVVTVPDVASLRFVFDTATLGAAPTGGEPTILAITALRDGGLQTLDATHLRQWQNTSAYFNGNSLLVEIVADPDAAPSRVAARWRTPPRKQCSFRTATSCSAT